jgi:hypothetical protein
MTFEEFFYSNQSSGLYIDSDKGTTHDYIRGYYNKEFTDKRNQKINLLEIGVYGGQSMKLWSNWFVNGTIYGIDIITPPNNIQDYGFFLQGNAYNSKLANAFADNFFHYIIDDGPHTLESQISFLYVWYPKVVYGGKMIIEDIQNFSDVEILQRVASNLGTTSVVYDLRNNVNRYDDVIIEITKQ